MSNPPTPPPPGWNGRQPAHAGARPRQSPLARYWKRAFDLLVAGSLGVLLLPVALVTALLIRWQMGSPVCFRQRRPGLHGNVFEIWKFRTMRDGPEPDEVRLTTLGRWLRRLSLDELPQLINVLRGEMSLVGPRPLLEEYLPLYSPEQARRHEVPPGITGWAQVNGRNALTWDDTFALDVWYVDHWSPTLDLRILLMTALRVLHGTGVSQPGLATREKFTGPRPRPSQEATRVPVRG